MTAYYLLVFGVLTCFFTSVVWALHWAVRHGQFSNFQKGARSIFDEDELGQLTDCFPDMKDEVEARKL